MGFESPRSHELFSSVGSITRKPEKPLGPLRKLISRFLFPRRSTNPARCAIGAVPFPRTGHRRAHNVHCLYELCTSQVCTKDMDVGKLAFRQPLHDTPGGDE